MQIVAAEAQFSYDDQIVGGAGVDQIRGELGDDFISGGGGNDFIYGDRSAGDPNDPNPDLALANELHGDDVLLGGAGEDTISGNFGDDIIYGGSENDTLVGDNPVGQNDPGGGDDSIYGEGGDDTLIGGAGNDLLVGGADNDILVGGLGEDTYVFEFGSGEDEIFDTSGPSTVFLPVTSSDEVSAIREGSNIRISYGTSDVLTISVAGFLNTNFVSSQGSPISLPIGFQGSDVADDITTTGAGDNVFAGAGDDTVNSLAGDDIVDGGLGRDEISLGAGDDTGIGGEGNDTIEGGTGADLLFGDEGDDTLNGGAGNDTLAGGEGEDTLTGGEGDDTYRYAVSDIDANGLDTLNNELGGFDRIEFIGTLTSSDLQVALDGTSLQLIDGRTGEQLIELTNYRLPSGEFNQDTRLESIVFSDNSSLDSAEIETAALGTPPLANTNQFSTNEDTEILIDISELLADDTDADGDALSFAGVGQATNGQVSPAPTAGFLSFVPDENFNGVAEFEYFVTDGEFTSTGSVEVVVEPVDDGPQASADTLTTNEDTELVIPASVLLANDQDADGDALFITEVTDAVGGTAELSPEGVEVVFTPDPEFSGEASFNYIASDGTSSSAAAVTVDVVAVNDPPTAVADEGFEGIVGAPIRIGASELLANDSDQEGDALQIVEVRNAVGGAVVIDSVTGFIEFTPSADHTGDRSFEYGVSDGTDVSFAQVDLDA